MYFILQTVVPDTEPLVELALVLCSSCPFYRQWRTGPQCLEQAGAQWIWGQHIGSQREVNFSIIITM